MLAGLKALAKKILPAPICNFIRFFKNWRDLLAAGSFLLHRCPRVSFADKVRLLKKLYAITFHIESPHALAEILAFIHCILSLPPAVNGVVVEAGCFKGSSTAKFSLAADLSGRELVVFDSFAGLPGHSEPHGKTIFGVDLDFKQGDYCGTLEEVRANIAKFGKIESCRFIKGWFADTMPGFHERVAAIFLDVDLAQSTRTCLKYLFPLLEKGGRLYSHDGHLPLVMDVFNDDDFWLREVGCRRPVVQALGNKKLLRIIKQD